MRDLWRSLDAFGRRFMDSANPILGPNERKLIEEAARQRETKEAKNG